MKAAFNKFNFFIRKYFLAEFIFILIFYGMVMYYLNEIDISNSDSLRSLFLQVTLFALFMTLVNRFLRNNIPFKPQPMELGDHASYFVKGQRPKLKAFLENKGYSLNIFSFLSNHVVSPIKPVIVLSRRQQGYK